MAPLMDEKLCVAARGEQVGGTAFFPRLPQMNARREELGREWLAKGGREMEGRGNALKVLPSQSH